MGKIYNLNSKNMAEKNSLLIHIDYEIEKEISEDSGISSNHVVELSAVKLTRAGMSAPKKFHELVGLTVLLDFIRMMVEKFMRSGKYNNLPEFQTLKKINDFLNYLYLDSTISDLPEKK